MLVELRILAILQLQYTANSMLCLSVGMYLLVVWSSRISTAPSVGYTTVGLHYLVGTLLGTPVPVYL